MKNKIVNYTILFFWCIREESNPQHTVPKTVALSVELLMHIEYFIIYFEYYRGYFYAFNLICYDLYSLNGGIILFKEYGELSTILYEHTKPVGHSINGDIEYYLKELRTVAGRVLEAGVGTGRMFIPLIENGIKVDGVDVSEDMLRQCKLNMEKYNIKGDIFKQDLKLLSLPYKYDAIIMPTGSFCLLERENIQQILNLFYSHLNIGGKIIIDLEMPIDFKNDDIALKSFPLNDEKGIIFTDYSEKIDWLNQKVSYIHKYELVENGKITKTEISNFILY